VRRDFGLVDDRLEVAEEVGELGARGGVEVDGGGGLYVRGNEEVGEGEALADEEGAGRDMLLEGVEGAGLALEEGGVDLRNCLDWKIVKDLETYGLAVGSQLAGNEVGDLVGVERDLRVGEVDPLVNERSVLLGVP
jgi:hypothetical protein